MAGETLSALGGTGMLAFIAAFVVLAIIIGLAIYVYVALAYMTIARKLKHPYPWLAWIPFANFALILQLGGFHWAWVFLVLIPILGWIVLGVLGIISMWRIYEKRKYSGWLSLVGFLGVIPFIGWIASIANLIILGFVAWKDQ